MPSSKPKPLFRGALLCDSVYSAADGTKHLCGVKQGQIDIDTKPAFMKGIVFAYFDLLEPGEYRLHLEVEAPGFRARGTAEPAIGGNGAYVELETPIYALVSEDSVLRFRWKVDEGRWSKPVEWRLALKDKARELDEGEVSLLRDLFVASVKWESSKQARQS